MAHRFGRRTSVRPAPLGYTHLPRVLELLPGRTPLMVAEPMLVAGVPMSRCLPDNSVIVACAPIASERPT